jgi:hypothetical protein
MKGLHVIHSIDAANAALKCLVGHRSKRVKEIITQAMMILSRLLLLVTG